MKKTKTKRKLATKAEVACLARVLGRATGVQASDVLLARALFLFTSLPQKRRCLDAYETLMESQT